MKKPDLSPAKDWFEVQGWKPLDFQEEAWNNYLSQMHGFVNAPTGSGKTYSVLLGVLMEAIQNPKPAKGLQLIWITPIRALAKEITIASERAVAALLPDWKVEARTGDTTVTQRKKQWENPPNILITTPESIHVMLATKGYPTFFKNVKCIVADEWHELIGSKRGVLVELALSRFKTLCKNLKIWGISATIGNLHEASLVLFGNTPQSRIAYIKADIKKEIEVKTLLPDEIERFPWAGHIGLRMAEKILPIIHQSNSTLMFTNTRAMAEIWYQHLLQLDPNLAGQMAMHHGSISKDLRDWVENALYEGVLKAVVCTSSLDLGVDFRPVDTIIQVGSPKGVARFVQRAGRSGHRPGAASNIYFVPTHSLELIEAAALRTSIANNDLEERIPYIRSFDVLMQYVMTLAVSEGFEEKKIFDEVSATFCFESMTREEWLMLIHYLQHGSQSLQSYNEYRKLDFEDGIYKVTQRKVAQIHKLSIGTIVSDAMISIQYVRGKHLGSIEEWFVTQLEPGDAFWFAGRALELVRFKDLIAQVKDTTKTNGRVPSYMGGRISLSSQMSKVLRLKLDDYLKGRPLDPELEFIKPLFEMQRERSCIPELDEFLVEYFESDQGWHLIMFPFEGRYVHEGMAALLAKRISMQMPISFSIAMNDYGFELLSDQKIDVEKVITKELFQTKDLVSDIQSSINSVEMAKRKFRDIATISGLVFTGYPGRQKRDRHLQASAQLLFGVFHDYEPDNLLYQQTYEEVMTFQLEEARLRRALHRILEQKFIYSFPKKPTPFAFPLIVDRLREKLTSEKLEDRIRKMKVEGLT